MVNGMDTLPKGPIVLIAAVFLKLPPPAKEGFVKKFATRVSATITANGIIFLNILIAPTEIDCDASHACI